MNQQNEKRRAFVLLFFVSLFTREVDALFPSSGLVRLPSLLDGNSPRPRSNRDAVVRSAKSEKFAKSANPAVCCPAES